MDNNELKQTIKARLDLAEYIRRDVGVLGGGPNEFKTLCPFHKESTPSFTVFLKEGTWGFHCFGCGAGGDAFEWVMRRKGLDFPAALRLLAGELGLSVPPTGGRIYQPPEARQAAERRRGPFNPSEYRALTVSGPVYQYLTENRRLHPEILEAYSVGEKATQDAYAFAYKWRPEGWPANREPKFEFAKVVLLARPEGKKVERRDPPGGKNILFGMCAPAPAGAVEGELMICEGEINAMTWAQYGFRAVSVPGGAAYTGWIDICWEWLQAFTKIHICFDEDTAGRLKVVEVVKRLGMARTDMVRLPEKTVNNEQSSVAGVTENQTV